MDGTALRRLSARPVSTSTRLLTLSILENPDMSVPFRQLRLKHMGGVSDPLLALVYAQNVFAAIDRRMPEARGLAGWLTENATAFGLDDATIPDAWDGPSRSRRGGVTAEDWLNVKAALDAAMTAPSRVAETPIACWTAELSRVLQLDEVSSRILSLALHYKFDKRVEGLLDVMSECRGGCRRLSRDAGLLALLLDVPSADIAKRLTVAAKLLASGLLQLDRFGCLEVQDRLAALIRQDIRPATDFYDQLLGPCRPASLPWEAFAHLSREADIAASVLRAALAGRETGVSILLYGPPGTGKTSFAATLAARVGARLRPVAEADEDGDEPQRHHRLAGLRLAQRLAPSGGTVLLFDEAEDLFVRRGIHDDEPVTSSRVFIHRLLEELTVPVIWTANDISVLGPAVLRRMTMCLELKVPNLATRTRLWRRMGEAEGVVLQDADAARLARLIPAAPAVASGAMRATRLAGGGAETARLIVEGVARAVRGGELPVPEKAPDAMYDPALVNADCDLAALAADLLRPGATRAVSFLLSGPPGAGKSAWVRHLAGRMGMPVLHKRASDLLNPFVGGTEQNIAGAFAEAREAQAFLVFDEADSLLLERADAVRSWEISQVNEMLTWMEGHELPFACTTNLAERLDRASLRRFLVKLRFDWLTAAQARLAFRQFFGMAAPAGLDDLRTLTPADFALVRRRAAVRGGEPDPAALMCLLKDECQGRVGARLPVGFGRPVAA
jgi:transitional endoplasmic reticulum ATPase